MTEYDVPCDRDDVLCRAIINSILKKTRLDFREIRVVREIPKEELAKMIKTEGFPIDKVLRAYEIENVISDVSKLELRSHEEALNKDVRIPYIIRMNGIYVEYDSKINDKDVLGAFGEDNVIIMKPLEEESPKSISVHITRYKVTFDFDKVKREFLEFSKRVKEKKAEGEGSHDRFGKILLKFQ